MKKPTKVENEILEDKIEEAPVVAEEFYDGFGDTYITTPDLKTAVVRKKINLDSNEVKNFLGGVDPKRYFREGKVPMFCVKAFGDLLGEDNEERAAMQKVLKDFEGLLFFKNRKQNLYTILVPKELSEFELDQDGEFIDTVVHYDIRTINFSGGSTPSAFEIGYFQKYATGGNGKLGIIGHFHKARQKRAGFI